MIPGMDGGFPLRDRGRAVLLAAVVLAAVGAALTFADRVPWIGRLPGDLVFRRDRATFYVPIATCVVLSVVISAVLWWLGRR
jgi:hypothetical protein